MTRLKEFYCALCGVPFGVDNDLYRTGSVTEDDVVWTQYYTALREVKYEEPCDWYLSGIGRNQGSEAWDTLVPTEPDCDARKQEDWPCGHFCDSVLAYTKKGTPSFYGDVNEVLYPMHPPCWDIFRQKYALLATRHPLHPNLSRLADIILSQDLEKGNRGLIPSWAGDYAGPEQFWSDGWTYNPDPDASELAGLLEVAPEWDFLVHDPSNAQGFASLLENPPLANDDSNSSTMVQWRGYTNDPFSRLPPELLMEVLCLLPTASGQAVRLASRAMASISLSSSFWRSRFDFPNEFCHIKLPQRLQTRAQADNLVVDWRKLCDQLLHSAGESWQNRKRIMTLNEKLARILVAYENDIEEDDNEEDDVEEDDIEEES